MPSKYWEVSYNTPEEEEYTERIRISVRYEVSKRESSQNRVVGVSELLDIYEDKFYNIFIYNKDNSGCENLVRYDVIYKDMKRHCLLREALRKKDYNIFPSSMLTSYTADDFLSFIEVARKSYKYSSNLPFREQKCKDCGKRFTLTRKDVARFESNNLHLPSRCIECRDKNRDNRIAKYGKDD